MSLVGRVLGLAVLGTVACDGEAINDCFRPGRWRSNVEASNPLAPGTSRFHAKYTASAEIQLQDTARVIVTDMEAKTSAEIVDLQMTSTVTLEFSVMGLRDGTSYVFDVVGVVPTVRARCGFEDYRPVLTVATSTSP